MNCPKCDADISESYEPDDHSVGIVGGWYCDACDLGIGEHEVGREPLDDDVPLMTAREFRGARPWQRFPFSRQGRYFENCGASGLQSRARQVIPLALVLGEIQ